MPERDAVDLLAAYWLRYDPDEANAVEPALRRTAKALGFSLDDTEIETAVSQLGSPGDPEAWVVRTNFMAHPHVSWNIVIAAVEFARTDEDLGKIAAGPAEHLLAHYGSLIPIFEWKAERDPKFHRMLTGVFRHRMSDNVWARVRKLQAEVEDPLPQMQSFDRNDDGQHLNLEDRENDDKGSYLLVEGEWLRRSKVS